MPGRTLKWKNDDFWSRGSWVCEDQHGDIVAGLKRIGLSISKTGTFELGRRMKENGEGAVLEIVAVGIALIGLLKKQDRESLSDVEGRSVC